MKTWQRIKRRPRLTAQQRIMQSFMPVGYLANRWHKLKPIIAQGELGRVDGFRVVVSEELR